MKRSDLIAGETYAVMSPATEPTHRYVGEVKKVTVIDPDALATQRDSWGWRAEDEVAGTIELQRGDTGEHFELDIVGDYSQVYSTKPSYTSVGAWVVRHETQGYGEHLVTRNYLTAVPLSQIRMTWAEYQDIRDAVHKRFEAEQKVREALELEQVRLKAMAKVMEKNLNDQVKVSGVQVACSPRSDGSISTKLEMSAERAAEVIAFLNARLGR